MGIVRKLMKVVGVAEDNKEKIAEEASKRSSKVDEQQVETAIDKASDLKDEKK